MSLLAISTKKWTRKSGTAIHAALSLIIFFFLDLADAALCVVYELLDELLEGNSQSCYCNASPHTTGENEVSETLFKRRNVFREMGFLGFVRKFKLSGRMVKSEKTHRWSDCGCQSCNSWTKNEDGNLHVVVKDSTPQEDSAQEPLENVIFIHGFMGSSYFWTETVFEHVNEERYRLFAVDLLGFGESPKPRDSLYRLRDHVEAIERSVIKPYQVDSFHVVAHSMGCLIALSLAAKHSTIVKSVTLVAPPYLPSSLEGSVLTRIAGKRLWPPLAFGTAVMSWYEHVGRCVCFIVCKHHKIWESLIKLCTGKREIPWKIKDITRHTHHSAWHSMHNVICGGSKFADKHLETLVNSSVKIHLMQGDRDEIVPLHFSGDMKRNFQAVEVEIVVGADHESVIGGRREEFDGYQTGNMSKVIRAQSKQSINRSLLERISPHNVDASFPNFITSTHNKPLLVDEVNWLSHRIHCLLPSLRFNGGDNKLKRLLPKELILPPLSLFLPFISRHGYRVPPNSRSADSIGRLRRFRRSWCRCCLLSLFLQKTQRVFGSRELQGVQACYKGTT
ncbi:unnamed protein product [Brassica rapa subsp. trilocularis]